MLVCYLKDLKRLLCVRTFNYRTNDWKYIIREYVGESRKKSGGSFALAKSPAPSLENSLKEPIGSHFQGLRLTRSTTKATASLPFHCARFSSHNYAVSDNFSCDGEAKKKTQPNHEEDSLRSIMVDKIRIAFGWSRTQRHDPDFGCAHVQIRVGPQIPATFMRPQAFGSQYDYASVLDFGGSK
jgi:hypothetical protein